MASRLPRAGGAAAGSGRIKEALGRLFMKIHPDLLWASPERRKANEAAMQGLNEILAWEKGMRQGTLAPPPQTTSVAFFSKDDAAEGNDGAPASIHARFELPGGFTPDAHNVPDASKAVNAFLSRLLVRAEVLGSKDQEALEAADDNLKKWKEMSQRRATSASDAAAEAGGDGDGDGGAAVKIADVVRGYQDGEHEWVGRRREKQRLRPYEAMGDFGAAFDGMDIEVPEGAHQAGEVPDPVADADTLRVPPVQPSKKVVKARKKAVLGHLAEDFHTMMKDVWGHQDVPDVAELVTADLIHYDKEISPVDCAKAVATLQEHLPALRYDLWYFVPIFVTTRFGVETDIEGFLSIPYWFEQQEFLSFVVENEAVIRSLQDAAYSDASVFERRLAETTQMLGLADIIVRCSFDDAKNAIDVLRTCRDVLEDSGWSQLAVEIVEGGWQYGARESGVLQLPADFTKEGLEEFCVYLKENEQLEQVCCLSSFFLSCLSSYFRSVQTHQLYAPTHRSARPTPALSRSSPNSTVSPPCATRSLHPRSSTWSPRRQASLTNSPSSTNSTASAASCPSTTGATTPSSWVCPRGANHQPESEESRNHPPPHTHFHTGPLDLDWSSNVISLPPNFHGPNFARTVHMLHEEDKVEYGEEEPDDIDSIALNLEAKRIRSELVSTGLLELDPEKQTEQQRTLMKMVETYSGDDDIQHYIKESFPQYQEDIDAQAAGGMELLSQLRGHHTSYTTARLRKYYKSARRPRIGSNLNDWDFL